MNRRDLLLLGNNTNITTDNTSRQITTGIEPYTGKFDTVSAGHLLRRTTFACTKENIDKFSKMSLSEAVDAILSPEPSPADPLDPTTGKTWHDLPYDSKNNGLYVRYLKTWWLGNILKSDPKIHQKLTLFWHNHFVTEAASVNDARYIYSYYKTLQNYALGNIQLFTMAITVEPAMLRYLNGNTNTASRPNENYGRELQELFTIGKGPEISPGNYTNYSEHDVQTAAKVLTGWKDNTTDVTSSFILNNHDKTDKTFSSDYGNKTVKGRNDSKAGLEELNDMIGMIFSQTATSQFLTRKLYRWFVYYEIDAQTEANVIVPLAKIMVDNNFEIKPVLRALFSSAHFNDSANIGCMIKNPVDFITQMIHGLGNNIPDMDKDPVNFYKYGFNLAAALAVLEMNLFDPPNVAGWSEYYQEPDYYRLWLNTATFPQRNGYTDVAVYGSANLGSSFAMDVIAFTEQHCSNPADAKTIIKDITDYLMVIPLTQDQLDFILSNIFIPGLPDYEWTVEWSDYKSNPNDKKKKSLVQTKLMGLLKFILRLPEYQLM